MINSFTPEAIERSYSFDQAATAMKESGCAAPIALATIQALLLAGDKLGQELAAESVATIFDRPEFREAA